MNKTNKHIYVGHHGGKKIGEFKGSYPKQAVCKLISRVSRKNHTELPIKVSVREIEKKKTYSYIGQRIKLEHPRIVQFYKHNNCKIITFKYRVHAKRHLKNNESC